VDHIHARFRDGHPEVVPFMDEESLRPGDPACEKMIKACTEADVGMPSVCVVLHVAVFT
jgi:hypothetical protein